jgi:hypothetical protein
VLQHATKHTQPPSQNGQRRWKWPPNAPNEASSPAKMHHMDERQPLEQAVIILGGVRGCMAIRALHVPAMMHRQHRSVLRAIHPLTPPKIITTCSGGLPPSSNDDEAGRKASCGAQGGHFCQRWPGWLWLRWSLLAVGGW